jgi:hypothetical protein
MAFLAVVVRCPPQAHAEEPSMSGRCSVCVQEVGDLDVKMTMKVQTADYNVLRQSGVTLPGLAKLMGIDDSGSDRIADFSGNFLDGSNQFELSYRKPGGARMTKPNHWMLNVQPGCQLVSANDNRITLMSATTVEGGVSTLIIDMELPAGAKNAGFNPAKREVTYTYTPKIESGQRPELQFNVDHKASIMSSLAKVYSNPVFSNLWVARAEAKNTGDQVLSNYRVRFRVSELSPWSPWQRCAKVFPGQTVVDAYFPIFDLEKIMELNGSRPATIEAEYEYELADGTKLEETDAYPIQVLSRNEVIFSSLAGAEIDGFADQFNMVPAVVTAMTTPADPVVQQLAGHIHSMAASIVGSSISAQTSDQDCLNFIAAIQYFIRNNAIAYQTPPGYLAQGLSGQHIKYPRDVLRNRAGTCIDLAILWASLCEAAGLQPGVMVVSGHAFPMVRLPESGQWLPIESTLVHHSLEDVLRVGKEAFEKAAENDRCLVDISNMRRAGVVGLDLPNVSEDFLTKLGYEFTVPTSNAPQEETTNQVPADKLQPNNDSQPVTTSTDAPVQEEYTARRPPVPKNTTGTFQPNGKNFDLKRLVGTWEGRFEFENSNDTEIGLKLDGNGSFWLIVWEKNSNDEIVQENQSKGRWSRDADGRILFTTNNGEAVRALDVELNGDMLTIDFTWYSPNFYPILSRMKNNP